jgi:hypothetical protein
LRLALSIVVRLGGGVILLAGGLEEESVAGVIGAVLVGGSVIPAWYRDKIERLKAGRSGQALADGLEERLADLELRHREQMAQMEQVHSGRVAELEERIDFTERLLSKRE